MVGGVPISMNKYKFSLVACARWEARYIIEWICYHRSIGFDHVYLYCNDDEPTELYEVLLPFTNCIDPFVTFLYYPEVGQQSHMYLHFLKNFKNETEFFSFLDIDEFIRLASCKSIHQFWMETELTVKKEVDSIYLNWCMFGNSGFVERPPGSVLVNYHRREKNFSNYMTKHVTRASAVDVKSMANGAMADFWHYWNCLYGFENLVIVDVFGNSVNDYYHDVKTTFERIRYNDFFEKTLSKAVINHYVFKSKEDFIVRTRRSTSGAFAQQVDYEKAYHDGRIDLMLAERNQVEDVFLREYWTNLLGQAYSAEISKEKKNCKLISGEKPCTQSSISRWSKSTDVNTDAGGAVNGIINGSFKFHTDIDERPWWLVDLVEVSGISEIIVFNRLDDVAARNRSACLAIEIGLEPSQMIEVYRRETDEPFGGIDGNPLIFKPTIPIPGRFVRIRLLTRNYLHLDQVEVYGEPLSIFAEPARTA